MFKVKLNLRKMVAIAICLAGFSVSNVLAQDNTKDQGVVINGVKWATRNVDKPGTFSDKPEAPGMFYQWNRRVGWSATDPLVNSDRDTEWKGGDIDWNEIDNEERRWEKSNDPSPTGWRIPTFSEMLTLLDKDKVINEWTTVNGVNGRKFTDKITGNSIFLPVVGERYQRNGSLCCVRQRSVYWSNYSSSKGRANGIGIRDEYALMILGDSYFSGFNVRPIAE